MEAEFKNEFVIQSKQILLAEYPHAFNPSILRWQGRYLLSFRVVLDQKLPYLSWIGLVWLNEDFQPISSPCLLNLREHLPLIPSRVDDARLIEVNKKIYLVYADNRDQQLSKGGFRMFIAELYEKEGGFGVCEPECLTLFEGENKNVREKNWVPFVSRDELLLAYSIQPHKILKPLHEKGECETIALSESPCQWTWGEPRGGTPALLIGEEFLAFFHSSKKMATIHSNQNEMLHYFMGAYTFSATPPFELRRMSPYPIVGENFYKGTRPSPYWKKARVVFPCGITECGEKIVVTFGRDDQEMWVVEMEKEKLLESLTQVERS